MPFATPLSGYDSPLVVFTRPNAPPLLLRKTWYEVAPDELHETATLPFDANAFSEIVAMPEALRVTTNDKPAMVRVVERALEVPLLATE